MCANFMLTQALKELQIGNYPNHQRAVLKANQFPSLTLERFYTDVIICYFQDADLIAQHVQSAYKESERNALSFLKILQTIGPIYGAQTNMKEAVESIYERLFKLPHIRNIIQKNRLVPNGIKISPNPAAASESLSLVSQQPLNKKMKNTDSKEGIHHQFIFLLAQMTSSDNYDLGWKKILQFIGREEVEPEKAVYWLMSYACSCENDNEIVYIFERLKEIIEENTLIQILVIQVEKQNYLQVELVVTDRIHSVMEDLSSPKLVPKFSYLSLVAKLIKNRVLNRKIVFMLLTPSKQCICQFIKKKSEIFVQFLERPQAYPQKIRQNKAQIWGQIVNSTKIQLLKLLIQENRFDLFMKIVKEQNISLNAVYNTDLIFALTELVEWIIDPLYQSISYSQCFINKGKNKCRQFPQGYHYQFKAACLQTFQTLAEVLQYGLCLVFARRSTLTKICRIFDAILRKIHLIEFPPRQFHQSEEAIKEIIITYIIPSVQLYHYDPFAYSAVNSLLDRFPIEEQSFLILQTFCQAEKQPLYCLAISTEKSQEMSMMLRKLTPTFALVFTKIYNLLSRHPLSTCSAVNTSILLIGSIPQPELATNVITKLHPLAKKIFIVKLLNEVQGSQKNLVASQSQATKSFDYLIKFIRQYFSDEKDVKMVRIVLEYFIDKLSVGRMKKKLVDMNNFQFFYGQVTFLNIIFDAVLPFKDEASWILDNDVSDTNNKKSHLLGAGVYLKTAVLDKITAFVSARPIRKNITFSLFNNCELPLNSLFFRMLISLIQQKGKIMASEYPVSTTILLHDRLQVLIMKILNWASFQLSTAPSLTPYFTLSLLQPLVVDYKIPFEFAIAITRKRWLNNLDSFIKEDRWKVVKKMIIKVYLWSMLYNYKNKVKKYAGMEMYEEKIVDNFLNFKIVALFWILDVEFLSWNGQMQRMAQQTHLKVKAQGADSIDKLLSEPKKTPSATNSQQMSRIQYTQFADLLQKQSTQQALKTSYLRSAHSLKLSSRFQNSIFTNDTAQPLLKIKSLELFLRHCIITRAMLSQVDAFYSWKFMVKLFKVNNTNVLNMVWIVCKMHEFLAKMVPYMTLREVSQFVPILAQLSMVFMRMPDNKIALKQSINRELEYYQTGYLTDQIYNQLIQLQCQTHNRILEGLMAINEEIYAVKNALWYISNVSFVPFRKQHGQVVEKYIEDMRNKFQEEGKEKFTTLVNSAKQKVMERLEKLRNFVKVEVKVENKGHSNSKFERERSKKGQKRARKRDRKSQENVMDTKHSQQSKQKQPQRQNKSKSLSKFTKNESRPPPLYRQKQYDFYDTKRVQSPFEQGQIRDIASEKTTEQDRFSEHSPTYEKVLGLI